MQFIKQYIIWISAAIILLLIYNTYNKLKTYNANNPNSLKHMLIVIPSTEQKFLFVRDFNLVSEDKRSTNLHGLTIEDISKLAARYRYYLRKEQNLSQKIEQ